MRYQKFNIMQVKVKKLHPDAVIPQYAKEGDAGLDLTATSRTEVEDKAQLIYGTGLSLEIPLGYVGLIFPRSSIRNIGFRLSNCVGVIDSGFRGEVMVTMDPSSTLVGAVINKDHGIADIFPPYEIGDRIAQLIIIPYPQIELVEADELSETVRGEEGFGSSGK